MNVFHYTATAAGWENSGDPDHNDNDFFREGLIYNIIVCLAVCLSGWPATSAALFILIDEFRSASVRMASPLLPLHNFLRLRCEFLAESMRKFRSAFGAGVFSSSTEPAPISLKIGGNPFGGYYHRPPPPSTSVVPQNYSWAGMPGSSISHHGQTFHNGAKATRLRGGEVTLEAATPLNSHPT